MRKIAIIFLLLISAVSILLSIANFVINGNDNIDYKIDTSKLKNGDLVLRCGRSAESYAVYLADHNSEFTHIGIIAIQNNTAYVIHAVPHKRKTVKKEKLSTFLNKKNASQFAVYRSNYPTLILQNVVDAAEEFYVQKIEFDSSYNLNNSSKLYCTELVLKAFEKGGLYLNLQTKKVDILINSYQILFPSEFTKNPNFYKIY